MELSLGCAARFKPALETFKDTITMGYLQESRKGFFQFLLTADEDTSVAPPGESAKQADAFIAINATSADLPALEQYAAGPAANKPLILWNLELDTLRSDLGEALLQAISQAGLWLLRCLTLAGCRSVLACCWLGTQIMPWYIPARVRMSGQQHLANHWSRLWLLAC